jgi:hypothetical protein
VSKTFLPSDVFASSTQFQASPPPLECARPIRNPMLPPPHAPPAPSVPVATASPAPDYLSYRPLCSSTLLRWLSEEDRPGPPRAPPWKASRGYTPPSPPPAFALSHITTYVAPFLGLRDLEAAACTASRFRYGTLYADVVVLPPRPPMRGRLFGARLRNPLLCARNDQNRPRFSCFITAGLCGRLRSAGPCVSPSPL